MSILSISHVDLDGLGSQIVLRAQFGEIVRMNLSYGKIDEYLTILDEYCEHQEPKKVFVTDLSFKFVQLERLSSIANKFPSIEFYFIDHHPFEEEDADYKSLIRDNFHIIISEKACATKLTYLYLKARFGLQRDGLEQFVTYVNAYDIWLDDTPEFKVGFAYNELFWSYKINHFWARFKDSYTLRNGDKEHYKELITKKNKLFKKLEDSGRVMKFEKRILLIFIDDFSGHVTIDYPEFYCYVVMRSTGGVSVRLKNEAVQDGITKSNVVKQILELDYINEAGGHPGAFGSTIIDATPHRMVEFSKHIVTLLDKELEKIGI